MPLIRLMDIEDAKARRRNRKDVNLSKTEKMVSAWWARGGVGQRVGPHQLPGNGEMRHNLRMLGTFARTHAHMHRCSCPSRQGGRTEVLKHSSWVAYLPASWPGEATEVGSRGQGAWACIRLSRQHSSPASNRPTPSGLETGRFQNHIIPSASRELPVGA